LLDSSWCEWSHTLDLEVQFGQTDDDPVLLCAINIRCCTTSAWGISTLFEFLPSSLALLSYIWTSKN
jgi:hypothetical protein